MSDFDAFWATARRRRGAQRVRGGRVGRGGDGRRAALPPGQGLQPPDRRQEGPPRRAPPNTTLSALLDSLLPLPPSTQSQPVV